MTATYMHLGVMINHKIVVRPTYFDTLAQMTLVAVDNKRLKRHGIWQSVRAICPELDNGFEIECELSGPHEPIGVIILRRPVPERANAIIGVIVHREPLMPTNLYEQLSQASWHIASYMFRIGCDSVSIPSGKMFDDVTDWDDFATPLWMATTWLPGCTMERIALPVSRKALM